jgi:hypothetical protein
VITGDGLGTVKGYVKRARKGQALTRRRYETPGQPSQASTDRRPSCHLLSLGDIDSLDVEVFIEFVIKDGSGALTSHLKDSQPRPLGQTFNPVTGPMALTVKA